ncbi:hypothetical protein WKY82_05355 [Gordonia malaquae]|uniref:hypothetical protein n=1 Tax=Gordonia malaquae TaxID=410332 RepID=UPI00301B4E20
MGVISWGRQHRWFVTATLAIIGVLVAVVVLDDGPQPRGSRASDSAGDWTRPPAELFAGPGRLVAASDSRWMLAAGTGTTYRYSIKDASGRTVGTDFDGNFDACARTRSGVLGCQIGGGFYAVDLESAARVHLTDVPASQGGIGPTALADGWVVGQYGDQRVVSANGDEKWRVPADENVVDDLTSPREKVAPLVVTYLPSTNHRRVRDADSGEVVADCECAVTLLAAGFATERSNGVTTVHAADGSTVETLSAGVRVIGGGPETLFAEPFGQVDAGPSRYRVRTDGGRVVWEGDSTNGPPRVCGDWLLTPDGVVSTSTGARLSGAAQSSYDCLGSGTDWVALPDVVLASDGRSWRPVNGLLDLVDGMLVNTVSNTSGGARAVVVYSPTEPAAPAIPEWTPKPDFTAHLTFTFASAGASNERTQITRVRYSATDGRWTGGADGVTQVGKSSVRRPAQETFILSESGDVIGTTGGGAATGPPCGPFVVTLDDTARVVVARNDGRPVDVGAQLDPNHVVAAGATCVGYSDRYLAFALTGTTGITLLPLVGDVRPLVLPGATGFASGRPFAVTEQPSTITVYPEIP